MEPYGTDLVATIAIALGAAFVAGYLARLIGLPAIVGYLLAGIAVGPFTPGLVADKLGLRACPHSVLLSCSRGRSSVCAGTSSPRPIFIL